MVLWESASRLMNVVICGGVFLVLLSLLLCLVFVRVYLRLETEFLLRLVLGLGFSVLLDE